MNLEVNRKRVECQLEMFLQKGLINQYILTIYASVAPFGVFQMIFGDIIYGKA